MPEEGVVADVIPLRKENFGSILDGGIVFFFFAISALW